MLSGKEPAGELSRAIDLLDDFLERRERSGKALSRENLKTLMSVHKELELAQPPYDILSLRERLHHEFVHNLERQALKNLHLIKQLETEWENFGRRFMKPINDETMGGVSLTAKEMRAD